MFQMLYAVEPVLVLVTRPVPEPQPWRRSVRSVSTPRHGTLSFSCCHIALPPGAKAETGSWKGKGEPGDSSCYGSWSNGGTVTSET